NGHGHNYRLEVSVRVPVHAAKPVLSAAELEQLVGRTVIDRYDHKHLNLDVPEFATAVPSVENIAKACHELLRDPVHQRGAHLASVRVWETDKTSATYPAPAEPARS
ncbi:MAG: 6-carboxytetrahydropterin synthase, partial [Phycisphaerae bacterium]|nr:6-carboxytetrahydropterin synthase [Phycisphaerae bacterium]